MQKIMLNPVKSILEQEYVIQSLNYELLETNIKGLIELHQKMHKDTWIMCCGMPGTGKSNLILWIWQLINSYQKTPCNLKDDVVETYNDLLAFLEKYFEIYGKTGLVDEGAFLAPSRKSMDADQRDLNEVMDVIRKRQKRILIAGSKPWKMDISVRERTDVFLRTFYNIEKDEYQFAYYNGSKIHNILCDDYIKHVFPDPVKFFKVCPPDFYGTVPKIDDNLDQEYQAYKDAFGLRFIQDKIEESKTRKQRKAKKESDIDLDDPKFFELTPEFEKELMTVDKVDHKQKYRKVNNGMKRTKC